MCVLIKIVWKLQMGTKGEKTWKCIKNGQQKSDLTSAAYKSDAKRF